MRKWFSNFYNTFKEMISFNWLDEFDISPNKIREFTTLYYNIPNKVSVINGLYELFEEYDTCRFSSISIDNYYYWSTNNEKCHITITGYSSEIIKTLSELENEIKKGNLE